MWLAEIAIFARSGRRAAQSPSLAVESASPRFICHRIIGVSISPERSIPTVVGGAPHSAACRGVQPSLSWRGWLREETGRIKWQQVDPRHHFGGSRAVGGTALFMPHRQQTWKNVILGAEL